MSSCSHRCKSILCALCTKSECAYPNIPADSYDPKLFGKCWRYECSLVHNKECTLTNCNSILSNQIESIKKQKQSFIDGYQKRIDSYNKELSKLKEAQLARKIETN